MKSLTGESQLHLCAPHQAEALGAEVHREVVEPFQRLQGEAARAGFDLRILSGFRSFDRQLSIWNRKARGELSVLDSAAEPLDIGALTPRELVFAILRWSALPGGSRHHWGTDLDVFDAAARPEGYEVQLIPEEVEEGGMFGALHRWLDERMAASSSFGFFRPYDRDRGGVAPERWHLSHLPVARVFQEAMTVDLLGEVIRSADMELKDIVLDHLNDIYQRFVVNISEGRT